MRVPCVAGNWKMHKTVAESILLVKELLPGLAGISGVESIICPPLQHLLPSQNSSGKHPFTLAPKICIGKVMARLLERFLPSCLLN